MSDRYPRTFAVTKMDRVVLWSALCGLIEPVYPKSGNGRFSGRTTLSTAT